MCLAIPARIKTIDEHHQGTVDILGVERDASFELTPDAVVGDYVLIHAGFSIEIVSEEDARETLDLIGEFPDLLDVPVEGADEVAVSDEPQHVGRFAR